jgi:23S rRNA (pseudouridine1915-N3)-methyltransferase
VQALRAAHERILRSRSPKMRLLVLAVGQRMPAWVDAGFQEYARRMPRELRLELREVRPQPRASTEAAPGSVQRWLKAEADRLRAASPAGSIGVALDERGRTCTSQAFARLLEGWRKDAQTVAFLIGGADGLHDSLKRSARLMLSLSAMTLPHQLVRVILAEQLYRAAAILAGHPYHRA